MSSFGDFIALSDVCDKDTASLIKREVSDGVIAPGFTDEALEILKAKKKGNYCVIKIDENYRPAPLEHKQVFGITFEQGRQELPIDDELLSNVVTENKEIPEAAKRDLKIALITLKYTQSNSVCFVKDGQAIGVGAGQQSRVHCTRLAGQKADNWFLRQCPKVLDLQFVDGIRRPDRDNAIDVYLSDEYEDVLRDGAWQAVFKVRPEPLTAQETARLMISRDQFAAFWRILDRHLKQGKLETDLLPYLRSLAAQVGGCDSFLRAALALTVFQERGLISLSRQEDRVTLCLNPIQGKVDLYASPCLRRLRGGAEVKRGDSQ